MASTTTYFCDLCRAELRSPADDRPGVQGRKIGWGFSFGKDGMSVRFEWLDKHNHHICRDCINTIKNSAITEVPAEKPA